MATSEASRKFWLFNVDCFNWRFSSRTRASCCSAFSSLVPSLEVNSINFSEFDPPPPPPSCAWCAVVDATVDDATTGTSWVVEVAFEGDSWRPRWDILAPGTAALRLRTFSFLRSFSLTSLILITRFSNSLFFAESWAFSSYNFLIIFSFSARTTELIYPPPPWVSILSLIFKRFSIFVNWTFVRLTSSTFAL